MLSNYLIGLREGVEAALVVTILLTYLVQTNRRQFIKNIWLGVATAIVISSALGAFAFYAPTTFGSHEAQETFAGVMSLIAVGLVTWMIVWMRNAGRSIAHELRGKLDQAIATSATTVAVMAFVAVAREGLETSLFFISAVQAAGAVTEPTIGFVLGLLTAVAIGYLLYRGAVRINLARFFKVTGYFLILVAAGVLTYAIHELQEVGILPFEDALVADLSSVWSIDTIIGSLAKGIFNFSPSINALEAFAWVAYVGITTWVFSRKAKETAEVKA